jgi:hypothetical protein
MPEGQRRHDYDEMLLHGMPLLTTAPEDISRSIALTTSASRHHEGLGNKWFLVNEGLTETL